MLDSNNNIILIGIKHLFIELYSYGIFSPFLFWMQSYFLIAPYDINAIKDNKSLTFSEFRKLAKQTKKSRIVKIGGLEMK